MTSLPLLSRLALAATLLALLGGSVGGPMPSAFATPPTGAVLSSAAGLRAERPAPSVRPSHGSPEPSVGGRSARPAPSVRPSPTTPGSPAPPPRPSSRATPRPTPAPTPAPACTLFPATNVWNRRVDSLPVRSDSATLVNTIGASAPLHPDFGEYLGYGIPINMVNSSTPRSPVSFWWPEESDAGPYPIPANPQIEGGGDRHILMWDTQACMLYELFAAEHTADGWEAGSGAIWNLRSNALRPDGWTSADAAGLPILPGLVRYDEVAAGAINHAIRFTAPDTRDAHIYPARHHAGDGNAASLPPMGLRVRLKASFDISGFSPRMRIILTAMKQYGMILADNGSPWFFSGTSDVRWDDNELNQLKSLDGSDFEVVDTAGFVNG